MEKIYQNVYSGHIRPAWLNVDLDSLAWNARQIKSASRPGALMCASIKADAYGHGAVQTAKTVLANGADMLSVALLDEAIELREAGIGAGVLILGALERERASEVINHRLAQTVSSFAEARALSDEAQKAGKQAVIHIKIDTGLGRLGFVCDKPSICDEIAAACALPGIRAEGVFTHFAASDAADATFTYMQLAWFNAVRGELSRRGLNIPLCHCSNSAAIFGFPESHLNMTRPGISLFGGAGKLPGAHHRDAGLRQVMSLHAKVSLVKNVGAGDSVGYGRRFVAGGPAIVATLPIGYADGYSRGLSCGRGCVLINGRRAPVAGTVCMDQLMVDVTGAGGVDVGDEAVLYGEQGGEAIYIHEIAAALNTIPHEIMCAVGRRVQRVYTRGGKPVNAVDYLRNIKWDTASSAE